MLSPVRNFCSKIHQNLVTFLLNLSGGEKWSTYQKTDLNVNGPKGSVLCFWQVSHFCQYILNVSLCSHCSIKAHFKPQLRLSLMPRKLFPSEILSQSTRVIAKLALTPWPDLTLNTLDYFFSHENQIKSYLPLEHSSKVRENKWKLTKRSQVCSQARANLLKLY